MSLDLPGFADPVQGSQSTFRAVLEAMAHPGSVVTAGTDLTPPAPLCQSAAAMLLTLIDGDTSLHLAAEAEAAREWIVFHTTPRITEILGEAAFAMALTMPDLHRLAAGSDDGPEEGATLILQVQGFGHGNRFDLSGPGLATPRLVQIAGLPGNFALQWQENHARFPRGVDLILCAGTALMALPRSLRIAAVREG
ncbi:MAG: phosphonate C-P lyase system protein PhnH [Acetobacteraceae bacterium]|nr:phosphonate C-P lyase system protein PhnH [Acetobacteraceae bacterium]